MPQSLSHILIHAVWSTKERVRVLDDAARPDFHAYLVGVFARLECPVIEVNSEPEHVHVLFRLARTMAVSDVMEKVKSATSAWLKLPPSNLAGFRWQGGYAVFSVSASQEAVVRRYIRDQRSHHARQTFQDEVRALLGRHGVAFNESYLWD